MNVFYRFMFSSRIFIVSFLFSLPLLVNSQVGDPSPGPGDPGPPSFPGPPAQGGPGSFAEFVGVALSILYPLVFIIIGLTVLTFIWGLARFILKAGDETEREKGKKLMVWGIIGLFVMLSIWGIIQILVGDLLGQGFFSLPTL